MNEVSTLTEVATLVGAVTGLVTALTALAGIAVLLAKALRKGPRDAAKNVIVELAEAAEDGNITSAELRKIIDRGNV